MSETTKPTVISHRSYAEELIDSVLAGNIPESVLITNAEYPNGVVMTRTDYYTKMIRSMGGERSPRYDEAMRKLAALDIESQKRVDADNEKFMKLRSEQLARLTTASPEDAALIRKIAESTGQDLPSFLQLTKNAAGAVVRTADQFLTGNPVRATPEEIERRRTICAGDGKDLPKCEKYLLEQERCSMCGCFIKLKTWLYAEHCPLKKW